MSRILMIEDDARLAAMVGEYLGKSGFELAHAATGEAGDAVTSDLFTELTAGADKQLWMVEVHLS